MVLLHGGYSHSVICLILVFLKHNSYVVFADTDEYQSFRVLAELYIVRKYDGPRKEMVVEIGGANDDDEKQNRQIRINPNAIEAGTSMVSNLEQFLWRQDPKIFEKPEILSSLVQECDKKKKATEEDLSWDDDGPDMFCTLKDSAIKFIEKVDTYSIMAGFSEYIRNEDFHEPINDDDDFESVLREAKCGIYLAPSTIPNAGNGMFTGVNITLGSDLDKKMPSFVMTDMKFNVGSIEDYVWNMEHETDSRFVRRFSKDCRKLIGVTGSLANYHPGLVNVERREGPTFKPILDSIKEPGAGAITDFESSAIYAKKNIVAGSEFFISYGNEW